MSGEQDDVFNDSGYLIVVGVMLGKCIGGEDNGEHDEGKVSI